MMNLLTHMGRRTTVFSEMTNSDTPKEITELLKEAGQAAAARRLDEAEVLLSRVLAVAPDNLKALDLMGFVRFFQQRYAECETFCKKALEIKPDHAYALSGLGMVLAKQGNLEGGLDMLEKAMEKSPAWPEPYWDAAVILIREKQLSRATEILNRGKLAAPKAAPRFETLLAKIEKMK